MNLLDALYLPAAVATAPWWARKTRGGWSERFGRIDKLPNPASGKKRLLLHAVSVGEVNTLRALVPLLAERAEVVVSCTTDTGLAQAKALFGPRGGAGAVAQVVRYPLDFSPAVRRFLDAVRPDAIGLVELELWPNFVAESVRRDIPVCVINGRLSQRSFRGYHRFRRFLARTFGALEFAAVQDSAYAQRFRAMGVREDRVRITGSMKWDSVSLDDPMPGSEQLAASMGIDRSRPLIVAGSTGPLPRPAAESLYRQHRHKFIEWSPAEAGSLGEEGLLHTACPDGSQLLCAPRRQERFGEAFAAMGGEGPGQCVRRTEARSGAAEDVACEAAQSGHADRFLLDTIGELRCAYALADIAVIGRSFGDLHGSDPIEPIALGKATVIGPRHSDFESIVEAFRVAGAIEVVEAGQLGRLLSELLADPARRAAMGEAGRRCVRENQGATARHAQMLLQLVGARAG